METETEIPGGKDTGYQLVKKISRNEKVSDPELEKKVFIHLKSQKTYDSLPGSKLTFRGYDCFIVSLANECRFKGEFLEIQLEEKSCELSISFVAKVISGGHEEVVKAFYSANSVTASLKDKIRFWFENFVAEKEAEGRMETLSLKEAKIFISKEAGKIGLRFTALRIWSLANTEPLQIDSGYFRIFPKELEESIRIQFLAVIIADRENLRVIASHVNIQEHLKQKLKERISEYTKKDIGTEELSNLLENEDRRIQSILNKILESEGWTISSLSFKHELDPLVHRITISSTQPLQVSTSDFAGIVDLDYTVKIKTHKPKQFTARFYKVKQLREEIEDIIRTTLANDLKYSDIQKPRGNGTKKITSLMNEALLEFGREVTDIKLVRTNSPKIEKFLTIKHPAPCPIEDTDVTISNEIRLRLTDEGLFLSSDIQDIRTAIKDRLEHAVAANVMALEFHQLETETDWQNEIRDKMREEAVKLGYELTEMIVLPQTWWRDFKRDGFDFTVGDKKEFATQLAGGSVNLTAQVIGKIKDLKHLKEYIRMNKGEFEKEVLEKETLHALTEALHHVTPQDFYTRFRSSTDPEKDNSIEKLLQDRIKEQFMRFECDALTVIITPQKTELIKRLAQMCKGFHSFKFEFFGHDYGVKGKFTIKRLDNSPNGWYTFHKNQGLFEEGDSIEHAINEIAEHIESHIWSWFKTNYGSKWSGNIDNIFDQALSLQFRVIEEQVRINFGLIITITDKPPQKSFHEIQAGEKLDLLTDIKQTEFEDYKKTTQAMSDHRKKQIEILTKRLEEETNTDGDIDHESIARIKTEIQEILKEQELDLGDMEIPEDHSDTGDFIDITPESMQSQPLFQAYLERQKMLKQGSKRNEDQNIEE